MSETVMIVDGAGVARVDLLDPAARAVLTRAAVPIECGPEIPVAPARGPMARFTPRSVLPTSDGGVVSRRSGYLGRDAARVIDVFDAMTRRAMVAHQKKGDDAGPFAPPFSKGQVGMAREYAALTERVSASGVKCSALETTMGSGGSCAGDREAAIFRDFQRLRVLHRRIGSGLAKEVRRVRPSKCRARYEKSIFDDGLRVSVANKRRAIYVRAVVDDVCLGGKTLTEVLRSHCWGVDAKARDGLRRALCAALDRMQGYDLQKGG